MKKCIHLLCSLILALFLPFTLIGCNEQIETYNVKVNVWYANYGTVYGSGTYNDGENATISATPKGNSQFIAWLHENIVVSYDSEYTFNVNKDTSGTYIAVFTCPDLELVTPTQIIYADDFEQNDNIDNIHISFAMGNSYDDLKEIYSSDVSESSEFDINTLIMALNKRTHIICEVNITFNYQTTIDNEVTNIERTEKTYIEINLQNDILTTTDYSLKLPAGIDGKANVKIVFENFGPLNQENS